MKDENRGGNVRKLINYILTLHIHFGSLEAKAVQWGGYGTGYPMIRDAIFSKHSSIISSSLVFSPKAGFGRNQSPVRRPVWLWHTAF